MTGPTKIVKYVCNGCSSLRLKNWDYYDENDYHDFGTTAKCADSEDRVISSYWSKNNQVPNWCPKRK